MVRVVVMGSGGVGGLFGGLLAHAGADVVFVARGAHLEAIRTRGLTVKSEQLGELRVMAPATDDPREAGQADLVLFAVKCYDTRAASSAIGPCIGTETAVLPLQNGVDSVDELGAALGVDHILGGVAWISSSIAEPGVIEQRGPYPRVVIGEPSGRPTPRIERIAGAFRDARVDAVASTDWRQAAWEKFVPLAAHATATSACQSPIGPILETTEGLGLYRALLTESIAVARATGIRLADDHFDRTMAMYASLPPGTPSSMQRDFEHGRQVELEHITGSLVRHGRMLGVPTPTFDALYATLKVRARSFGGLA